MTKTFGSLTLPLIISLNLKEGITVYLSKKLKELRQRDELSQEAVAARIYVTCQTVSNWETERSYPDMQSLLLLSTLFNVSLDELVKGDTEIMKNELDVYRMDLWSKIMLGCTVVGGISALPLYKMFGFVGFIPSALLIVVSFVAACILERIKKKYCLKTYSQILAFLEGKTKDISKVTWEERHPVLVVLLKLIGGGAVGATMVLVGLLIVKFFFE